MQKHFTQNDLTRYFYNETTRTEANAIENTLENDWDLQEQYQAMLEPIKLLDTMPLLAPSNTSIDIIMNYNNKKRTQEQQLQTVGS